MSEISTWDRSVPSDTSEVRHGASLLRSDKSILQDSLQEEHYFTDGSDSSAGVHKPGSARAFTGPESELSNPEVGRVFVTSDSTKIFVAFSDSTWTDLTSIASQTFDQIRVGDGGFIQSIETFSDNFGATNIGPSGSTIHLIDASTSPGDTAFVVPELGSARIVFDVFSVSETTLRVRAINVDSNDTQALSATTVHITVFKFS